MIDDPYLDDLVTKVFEHDTALGRELERAIEEHIDYVRREAVLDEAAALS